MAFLFELSIFIALLMFSRVMILSEHSKLSLLVYVDGHVNTKYIQWTLSKQNI